MRERVANPSETSRNAELRESLSRCSAFLEVSRGRSSDALALAARLGRALAVREALVVAEALAVREALAVAGRLTGAAPPGARPGPIPSPVGSAAPWAGVAVAIMG